MILKDRTLLARLMVIEGMSQRDLARAVGWSSHSYVGRLLRGQADGVAAASAHAIAHRLGVAVEVLFDFDTSFSPQLHSAVRNGRLPALTSEGITS